MIRPATASDAASIASIYNYYIANSIATFEEEPISAKDVCSRLLENGTLELPWLIAVNDHQEVVGYAHASKWKGRCSYRFSVEATVYISHDATSQGWGSELYKELFSALKEKEIHVVICGISLPNVASVALHEKLGMEKVAHFKEVGFKFNQWVDVGYWQCNLNA